MLIALKFNIASYVKRTALFLTLYAISTFMLVPSIAPLFGREKIKHSAFIKPTNYMTVILNRNYVVPDVNLILNNVQDEISGKDIQVNYLDANFPFVVGFPLLPHLSHNDGRKLDLSLVYESPEGKISIKQKSRSGYGVFEGPKKGEFDQITKCKISTYKHYDYSKYLSFGETNKELQFSSKGTKALVTSLLKQPQIEKLFIEPHLKTRLNLNHNKVRFHGCRSVRHDDHIHIQVN